MSKFELTKVEKAIDRSLQKILIENLSELAQIADRIQNPNTNLSNQAIKEIIARFQKELKKLKKEDPKLFSRLNLSPEEEKRFTSHSTEFFQADWLRLRELKLCIDELKKELYGEAALSAENEKRVATERRKHVNKRLGVRDGWLPLH